MGLALANAFVRAGVQLSLCDRDEAKVGERAAQLGARAYGSAAEMAPVCDLLVLCVKPGDMKAACESVRGTPALLVSVAAGVSLEAVSAWTASSRLVRAMPNTPARIGQGITALAAHESLGAEDLARATELFAFAGAVVLVDESQMHAVTALSGSGPAFLIAYAEAMIAAGTAQGLAADVAESLVLATISGTSAWIAASGGTGLAELRSQVTSKGGTTAAGLGVLQQWGFDGVLRATVEAASQRSAQMADAFR